MRVTLSIASEVQSLMLIKFESKRAAPFQMQKENAAQLLSMMGQGGKLEGSISGPELDAALSRLETALANQSDLQAAVDDDEEEREHVSLSARANPLREMMLHARKLRTYVMWSPD